MTQEISDMKIRCAWPGNDHLIENIMTSNGDKRCKHKKLKLTAHLSLEEWSGKKNSELSESLLSGTLIATSV